MALSEGKAALNLVRDLVTDLRELASLDLPPKGRTLAAKALDRAEHLAERLGANTGPILDHQVLLALLETAGNETALELLAQVLLDLSAIEQNLQTNLADLDQRGLRVDTHNLMSISGSLGASALYDIALTLNTALHGPSTQPIPQLLPQALAQLAELKTLVQRELDTRQGRVSTPLSLAEKEG